MGFKILNFNIFGVFRKMNNFWGYEDFVGSGHFLGFKILNFNIFGVFRKMNIFWGNEDFVDIFWRSSRNWTILRGHLYAFQGLFLRSRYRMGDIFWGC